MEPCEAYRGGASAVAAGREIKRQDRSTTLCHQTYAPAGTVILQSPDCRLYYRLVSKSGENATQYTLGTDSWTYRDRNPTEQAIFNSAMTGNSRSEARAVIEAYDFTQFDCIVDIGGGHGLLLM